MKLMEEQVTMMGGIPHPCAWSESDYLQFSSQTNHLIEWSQGAITFLPMPTRTHQLIVLALYRMLYAYIASRSLGTLLVAPIRVRLGPGQYREPDLVFMHTDHSSREYEAYFDGADLVIEVVSANNADHDLKTKREEYAQAGIPEYWIVNPQTETITVLVLQRVTYDEHCNAGRGDLITSPLLTGLTLSVDEVFVSR